MSRTDWSTRPLEDELGEVLRAELLSWPSVKARPMMGTLAFFRGRQMLGCYVNRALAKRKAPYLNRPTSRRSSSYACGPKMRSGPCDANR